MPDFAVSAAIRAVDKLSAIFHNMGNSVGRFGTQSGDAFDKAGKKANLFKSIFAGNFMANWATDIRRKVFQEIKQIPQLIEDFAAKGEEIGRTATMIGLSAEAFQRLSYAAKLTDTPVETLEGGFKLLNKSLAQFRVGGGTLHSLMAKINPVLARQLLTVKDSREAFLLTADAIAGTKDAQLRAAIAQAAFGKSGQELIPMLAEGRVGLEKLMKEADVYGSVLSDSAVEASGRLDDTLKRLRGSISSVKDTLLGTLVQAVSPYVEKVTEWIAAHKDLIATKLKDFISGVMDAIQRLRPVAEIIINVVGWMIGHTDALLAMYIGWTAAQIALNIALNANPIGLISLAVQGLIALIILMVKNWQTVGPVLENVGRGFMTAILYPVNLVIEAIKGLLWILSKLPGQAGASFQSALDSVQGFQDKMNNNLTLNHTAAYDAAKAMESAKPPNAEKMEGQGMRWNGHIWVHAEQGTTAKIENQRGAPPILGYAGAQYSGGAH